MAGRFGLRRAGPGRLHGRRALAAILLHAHLRQRGSVGPGRPGSRMSNHRDRLQLSRRAVHRPAQHPIGLGDATGQQRGVRPLGRGTIVGLAVFGQERLVGLRRIVSDCRSVGRLQCSPHTPCADTGPAHGVRRLHCGRPPRRRVEQDRPLCHLDPAGQLVDEPLRRGRSLPDYPLLPHVAGRGARRRGQLPQFAAWFRCCWSPSPSCWPR